MKKLLLLMLGICLLLPGMTLSAATQQKKPKPSREVIVRNPQDPAELTLLGKKYLLYVPEQTSELGEWFNFYVLNGEKGSQDQISIGKIPDKSIEDLIAGEPPDDYITFDTRNAQDVMISSIEDDVYVIKRLVQVGEDIFFLTVSVPEENVKVLTEEHGIYELGSLQFQKRLFQAVRNTPISVITEHFVEAVCRLGSDCQID